MIGAFYIGQPYLGDGPQNLFLGGATDALVLTDLAHTAGTVGKATDSVVLSDTARTSSSLHVSAVDAVVVADSAKSGSSLHAKATDAVVLVDNATIHGSAIDQITFSENVTVVLTPIPPPPKPVTDAPGASYDWPGHYRGAVSAVEAWERSRNPLGPEVQRQSDIDDLIEHEQALEAQRRADSRAATEAGYIALAEAGAITEDELIALLVALDEED